MNPIRVRLEYPTSLVREPVLGLLARRFEVMPNIRRASIEEDSGWVVCELQGDPAAVERALAWLRSEGVVVDLLGDVVES